MYKDGRPLLALCSEGGLTADEEETTEALTHCFAKVFTRMARRQMSEPMPIPMSGPFTWKEIYEASLKLDNNGGPDSGGLQAEHIGYWKHMASHSVVNASKTISGLLY